MRALLLICVLAACDGRQLADRPAKYERLGTLGFELPDDWSRADVPRLGHVASTWVPRAENTRKESVTVIRSEVDRAFFRRGSEYLDQTLRTAQAVLPKAKFSAATPVTTEHGLTGLRLIVNYVPNGQRVAYQRVHVVLLDKTGLIHVLYTARDADPDLAALEMVLSTLRREEA